MFRHISACSSSMYDNSSSVRARTPHGGIVVTCSALQPLHWLLLPLHWLLPSVCRRFAQCAPTLGVTHATSAASRSRQVAFLSRCAWLSEPLQWLVVDVAQCVPMLEALQTRRTPHLVRVEWHVRAVVPGSQSRSNEPGIFGDCRHTAPQLAAQN